MLLTNTTSFRQIFNSSLAHGVMFPINVKIKPLLLLYYYYEKKVILLVPNIPTTKDTVKGVLYLSNIVHVSRVLYLTLLMSYVISYEICDVQSSC